MYEQSPGLRALEGLLNPELPIETYGIYIDDHPDDVDGTDDTDETDEPQAEEGLAAVNLENYVTYNDFSVSALRLTTAGRIDGDPQQVADLTQRKLLERLVDRRNLRILLPDEMLARTDRHQWGPFSASQYNIERQAVSGLYVELLRSRVHEFRWRSMIRLTEDEEAVLEDIYYQMELYGPGEQPIDVNAPPDALPAVIYRYQLSDEIADSGLYLCHRDFRAAGHEQYGAYSTTYNRWFNALILHYASDTLGLYERAEKDLRAPNRNYIPDHDNYFIQAQTVYDYVNRDPDEPGAHGIGPKGEEFLRYVLHDEPDLQPDF